MKRKIEGNQICDLSGKVNAKVLPRPSPAKQQPQCQPQQKFQTQHYQVGQVRPKQIDAKNECKRERLQTEVKNQYQFIRLNKRLVVDSDPHSQDRRLLTNQVISPNRFTRETMRPNIDSQERAKTGGTAAILNADDEDVNYDSIEFDSALEVDIEEMIDIDEGIGPQRAGRLSETHVNKMKHAFKSQSLSGTRTNEVKCEPKFSNGILVSQINLRAVQTNVRQNMESSNFEQKPLIQHLSKSESMHPIKTLQKNQTLEQIGFEAKKHNFIQQNLGINKQNTGVNITKFGPIGQVGNCQIGGFGKSLNAIKPSQSYLGGLTSQNVSSQFCVLSPKVIPINNNSSQDISPMDGSPDRPEDILESSKKEEMAFEPRQSQQIPSEEVSSKICSSDQKSSQCNFKSPKAAYNLHKKKTQPLKNISNDFQLNDRGKDMKRGKNGEKKQYLNGQFEKTQQKAKKSKVECDDENPYTPQQKLKSRKTRSKDMQITTANMKLPHQSQKCNTRKKQSKNEGNTLTSKNSHRRNNFISEELKQKDKRKLICSPKVGNQQLNRRKDNGPTDYDDITDTRNEMSGTTISKRRSSYQISLQDGELDMSSSKKTVGERADIANTCTAIKHEGIKNDISQFQIKVTRIQNELDAQNYDFENKIRQANGKERINQEPKAEYIGYNQIQQTNKIELRRFSMKESKDYQQIIQPQHIRKSDPEGKIAIEPQTSSDLVQSDSRPSLMTSTNRSSKQLTDEPATQMATNRRNIPNLQENRASFLQTRQNNLLMKQPYKNRRGISAEGSKSAEYTSPPSPLSQYPMPHNNMHVPEPPSSQSQMPRRQLNNPDYFKVSDNKQEQDYILDHQYDNVMTQTEHKDEDEVNVHSDGGGLIATEGSLRPVISPRTTNANPNILSETNAFNNYMQTQEEQGNVNEDYVVPHLASREDNLTLGTQHAQHNFTTTQQQASYQLTYTQAGSRGQDRRATSKESVERAERFKMNSRKSQDILAAIKDSADKTARKIKNISLTRRRLPAQIKPNNADIQQVASTDLAPSKASTAIQKPSESRFQIQRYQSQQQLLSTYTKKTDHLKPEITKSGATGAHKQPKTSQKSSQKTQFVKKQKKPQGNPKIGQVQIKLENITGTALQANEQTGQQAPDESYQQDHEQAQRLKQQDNCNNNNCLQLPPSQNNDASNAYQMNTSQASSQMLRSNSRPFLQSKTTRNEKSYRVTEKWINQNRSEIDMIQEQIAVALTQTSHLIRNQRALDRHDRECTSRSNSKQTLMRSGTDSQIRQRCLVSSQQNMASNKQIQRDNHHSKNPNEKPDFTGDQPNQNNQLTVEEQLRINNGKPVVVNLQLKKPTLISQKSYKQGDRGIKLNGLQQAVTAMEIQPSKDSAINLKNIRDQRAGAKSPQLNFQSNQQQRFQRKASQPLLRTQSMHKFRNNKASFGATNVQSVVKSGQDYTGTKNLKTNKSANIANFYQTLPYKTGKQQIQNQCADSSMSRHMFNRDLQDCSSIILDHGQQVDDAGLDRVKDNRRFTDYQNKLIASVHIERNPQGMADDQYVSKRTDLMTDVSLLEKSRLSQSGTRKYGFQQQLKPRGSSLAVSRRAQSRQQQIVSNEPKSQLEQAQQNTDRQTQK